MRLREGASAWHTGRMAIFRKRDGDTPTKGRAAQDGAPPRGEAASNGAPAPDGDGGERLTASGLPRGNLLYLAEGYGLHSRDSVPPNGASRPDGEDAERLTRSGLPRGNFLYIAGGYGPLPDED